MILSLKWKIALNMWILAAVCTVLSGIIVTSLLIKNYETSLEQQLNAIATTLVSLGISDYATPQDFSKLSDFIDETLDSKKIDPIIQVFNRSGEVMFSSLADSANEFTTIFKPIKKPIFSLMQGKHKKYKILTTPYKSKRGRHYFLQIAMPYPLYQDIALANAWQAALLFFVLCVIALGISHLLAEKIIRPVRDIAVYLSTLNPAEVKQWEPLALSIPGGDYLRDIANGINALITRMKSAIYSMSRTSRYLAHELRNPLTILIGEAEEILAKKDATVPEYTTVIKSSLEEIERMNTVISTVLRLFKREKKLYNPSTCNLSAWLDDEITRWQKYLERPIAWQRPPEAIVALVDTDLLYRLLDNFIRNVKAHTPATSPTQIALGVYDHTIAISIADEGPGLPVAMIDALNKRDVSYDPLGIGFGLCLEIASICNFKLLFQNKESGGLKVTILIE